MVSYVPAQKMQKLKMRPFATDEVSAGSRPTDRCRGGIFYAMKACDHCWVLVGSNWTDCVGCRIHKFGKRQRFALWVAQVSA